MYTPERIGLVRDLKHVLDARMKLSDENGHFTSDNSVRGVRHAGYLLFADVLRIAERIPLDVVTVHSTLGPRPL